MKKYVLLFCFVLTFTAAWAQNTFEAAYEFSGYAYREPYDEMPIKLAGHMQGGSLAFTHKMQYSDLFWKVDFRYMGGETDYNGWLMTSPPTKYTFDDIGDYYWELRAHVGTTSDLYGPWKVWGSVGLGYRLLKDHMNKSPSGYLRRSQYLYMPAIAEFRRTSEAWTISFIGELDLLLSGLQTSYLADSDPSYDRNFSNNQNDGIGLRLSIKLQKELGSVGVFIEPFWRYWDIEDSDVALVYRGSTPHYMIEPHNTTNEYGLRMGFSF